MILDSTMLDAIRKAGNEAGRVSAIYNVFDEDLRLRRSPAARVEFLTTLRLIGRYLKPGDSIMDIGAGTGAYSLYFAGAGHPVTAVELAEANLQAFEKKLGPHPNVRLHQGNACDLSAFGEETYDIVLLLGPLYHLAKPEDRGKAIREALRVCKKGGFVFFSFISNDMVILTESCCYTPDFFTGDTYDHESFKLEDFPFVFFTVDAARQMLLEEGVQIAAEAASDGVSELLAEKINAMDEESYAQYLRYHFYCCEKPEMLGRSNHLLFVGRK